MNTTFRFLLISLFIMMASIKGKAEGCAGFYQINCPVTGGTGGQTINVCPGPPKTAHITYPSGTTANCSYEGAEPACGNLETPTAPGSVCTYSTGTTCRYTPFKDNPSCYQEDCIRANGSAYGTIICDQQIKKCFKWVYDSPPCTWQATTVYSCSVNQFGERVCGYTTAYVMVCPPPAGHYVEVTCPAPTSNTGTPK